MYPCNYRQQNSKWSQLSFEVIIFACWSLLLLALMKSRYEVHWLLKMCQSCQGLTHISRWSLTVRSSLPLTPSLFLALLSFCKQLAIWVIRHPCTCSLIGWDDSDSWPLLLVLHQYSRTMQVLCLTSGEWVNTCSLMIDDCMQKLLPTSFYSRLFCTGKDFLYFVQ